MTNKIELIVFDLDGTLTDSSTTIYKSTHRTFKELGLSHSIEKPILDAKIGAHFQDIFDDLNIEVGDVEAFIDVYKGFYFDYIAETAMYSGVIEILSYLKERQIKTALLTTKAQDQAEKILKEFELTNYFSFILGRRAGIAVKPSAEPLLFIMKSLGVKPENTLMIGDSELDVQCGKNAGTRTIGVTYGYRTPEMLKKEEPDFLIDSLEDLKIIIQ